MNILRSMLNFGWGDVVRNAGAEWSGWLPNFLTVLETVLWVLLAIVGAAGGIYALYVGIKMARADSAEARDENKKRLINIIVSIVVVVVLILFFNGFLPMILDAFGVFDKTDYGKGKGDGQSIRTIINTARTFLHI